MNKLSNLEVRGYSERGMINTLFHEMRYSPNGIDLLREFLNLCQFPNAADGPDFDSFTSARIRIEQSFSDFGDPDVLVLLEGQQKQAVFIEAKVKTYQSHKWEIEAQWDAFATFAPGILPTSNLFIQLYRKLRLVQKAQDFTIALPPDVISPRWSLGENGIVRKAATELSGYCEKVWYVALVPETASALDRFYRGPLQSQNPHQLPAWDTSQWGYLPWENLKEHCRQNVADWAETYASFDYNQGQIYGGTSAGPGLPSPPGTAVRWHSDTGLRTVVVLRRGKYNTRILLADGTNTKVPNSQLVGD